MKLRLTFVSCALALIPALAVAQSSTNHRISDPSFSNGGGPQDGVIPASVGTYDVYRSEVSLLPGGDTGLCLATQIPEPAQ